MYAFTLFIISFSIHFQPNSCSTQAPVWLDLTEPVPEVGQSVTSRACASWGEAPNRCCSYAYQVSVVNCGDFLVYRLGDTLACNIAYCAVGETGLPHNLLKT